MPLYEYHCSKCGKNFDVIQKFSDAPLTEHEDCGGKVEKLMSAPSFHLKGSGWYVTEYGKGGKVPAGDASDGKSDKADDKKSKDGPASEAKSGDSKSSESKADSSGSDSKSKTETKSKSESKPAAAPAKSD